MKANILVVDDEPDIRSSLKDILEDEGCTVSLAENGAAARRMVRQQPPDLILLDIWMPDIDGISLLKEFVTELGITAPVVMMSGHGTVETAVEATRLGAKDYIEKPLSLAKLLHTLESALQTAQAPAKTAPLHCPPPVGKSVQMQHLRDQLEHLMAFDNTVLFYGEPGSGKTFSARYLHGRSKRRGGPFLDVHTSLLHEGQGAAMLLGREDGQRLIPGYLDRAKGGSLFLDDVAELDSELQQCLYAVLSTGQWVHVNGIEPQSLDVRIMAGSRYDLAQEVRAGRFREDLFHLLNSAPIQVPPLREHAEDISELLQYYVNQLVDREGLPYRSFSVAAQNRLRHYHWPGNIRELESLVRRLLILGGESQVELEEVEAILSATVASGAAISADFDLPMRQAREQFEKAYLEYHLQQADGSVGKVAKQIGMERTHLYRKLRSLGIEARREGRDK